MTPDTDAAVPRVAGKGMRVPMRVTANVPRGIPIVIAAIFVAALIAGLTGLWSIAVAGVVVGSALIFFLARRWGRSLSREGGTKTERVPADRGYGGSCC